MSKCVGVEPEPEPTETEEPAPEEAEPETGGNTGMLLAVLAVALVGGGAAFYFKVLRPKQQKAAAPQEDYGDELTDYDEPDGYGDEDDDGPPWDGEDDDGEGGGQMRFTNSPYEKMMQQKPRPQAPAPGKAAQGPWCSRCPYWRGIGCVSCYRELMRPRLWEVTAWPVN